MKLDKTETKNKIAWISQEKKLDISIKRLGNN